MVDKQIEKSIIKQFIDTKGHIKSTCCSTRYLNIHKNIKQYLEQRYNDIPPELFTYKEVVYRMYNDINIRPICTICGNPLVFLSSTRGFKKACSNACIQKLPEVQNKIKQTCIKRYGETNYNKTSESKKRHAETCIQKYGCSSYAKTEEFKQRYRKTCLAKYGKEYFFQTDIFKKKQTETCLKKFGCMFASQNPNIKEKKLETLTTTIQKRYGTQFFFQSEYFKQKYKQFFLTNYNVDNVSKLPETKCKINQTKRKNNSFSISKPEDTLYDILCNRYGKNDIIRQYKSDVYPFNCDFYIISKKMFIEYQGTWLHGNHPFDANNKSDIQTLNKWEKLAVNSSYYKNAIHV